MLNKKIKNFSQLPEVNDDDDKDFHIRGIGEELLINPLNGDDEDEFVCNMHNFGDSDDLPNSDRAMISPSQKCHS